MCGTLSKRVQLPSQLLGQPLWRRGQSRNRPYLRPSPPRMLGIQALVGLENALAFPRVLRAAVMAASLSCFLHTGL